MRLASAFCRFVASACLIGCAGVVLAAPSAGLYSGQVPVGSQSEVELAEALKTAFGQVIVRVSGDPAALSKPEVAKAAAAPNRYVPQYQYQQDVINEGTTPQVRLTLVAQFDHDGVDRLLRDLGLAPAAAGTAGTETAAETPAPVADTRPGTFHVWVSGVRSAEDYARLIGAFSGNERIRDLQTELARGDGVQLRLGVIGSLQRLLETLPPGSGVRLTNAKPPVDGVDALLSMSSN